MSCLSFTNTNLDAVGIPFDCVTNLVPTARNVAIATTNLTHMKTRDPKFGSLDNSFAQFP